MSFALEVRRHLKEDKDHSIIVSFHWSIALLSIAFFVPHYKC